MATVFRTLSLVVEHLATTRVERLREREGGSSGPSLAPPAVPPVDAGEDIPF